MKKSKNEKFVDDGRTIANMNVEGMPWYNPATAQNMQQDGKSAGAGSPQNELTNLTGKETAAMIKGVIAAALLVGGIFVGGGLLFILFCEYIWLN